MPTAAFSFLSCQAVHHVVWLLDHISNAHFLADLQCSTNYLLLTRWLATFTGTMALLPQPRSLLIGACTYVCRDSLTMLPRMVRLARQTKWLRPPPPTGVSGGMFTCRCCQCAWKTVCIKKITTAHSAGLHLPGWLQLPDSGNLITLQTQHSAFSCRHAVVWCSRAMAQYTCTHPFVGVLALTPVKIEVHDDFLDPSQCQQPKLEQPTYARCRCLHHM